MSATKLSFQKRCSPNSEGFSFCGVRLGKLGTSSSRSTFPHCPNSGRPCSNFPWNLFHFGLQCTILYVHTDTHIYTKDKTLARTHTSTQRTKPLLLARTLDQIDLNHKNRTHHNFTCISNHCSLTSNGIRVKKYIH